jgi:hypothetical protein
MMLERNRAKHCGASARQGCAGRNPDIARCKRVRRVAVPSHTIHRTCGGRAKVQLQPCHHRSLVFKRNQKHARHDGRPSQAGKVWARKVVWVRAAHPGARWRPEGEAGRRSLPWWVGAVQAGWWSRFDLRPDGVVHGIVDFSFLGGWWSSGEERNSSSTGLASIHVWSQWQHHTNKQRISSG